MKINTGKKQKIKKKEKKIGKKGVRQGPPRWPRVWSSERLTWSHQSHQQQELGSGGFPPAGTAGIVVPRTHPSSLSSRNPWRGLPRVSSPAGDYLGNPCARESQR